MKLALVRIFSLVFTLQMVSPTVIAASLSPGAPDIEAPIIFFERGETRIPSGQKTFTARVTDNIGVANVTLFYRERGSIAFTPNPMEKLEDSPDVYSVDLYFNSKIEKELEIYLKAEDVSGNSVFVGRDILPLTYIMLASKPEIDIIGAESEKKGIGKWTWILIGLGVAVLAGGSSGSGGDSSGSGGDSSGSITVTTTTEPVIPP